MKKYQYIITSLIIFLLPLFTYADCTTEEINHFREIESEYRIESTLDKETGYYTLTLYNPEPDAYTYEIKTINTWISCEISKDSDTKCDYVPPSSYSINVIGNTETCDNTLKRTFLKLKPYNKYSEDPLCKGIEEFVLCQETYEKEIDYETFASRVNIYKEQQEEENKNTKNEFINIGKIKEYVEDNLFQVIVITIFIILLIITTILTIKSIKKSRRLE